MLTLALATVVGGILLRQLVILGAIARSAHFLRQREDGVPGADGPAPTFFVVLPVLREATVIAEAVAHFEAVVRGHAAQLIVVTTARERVEAAQHTGPDTVTTVEQIAQESKIVHLHYPNPTGLKGDQLNFAARYCADTLLGDVPARQAYLVCYDADSRPPPNSLDHFHRATAAAPGALVFHQSASFEVRPRHLDASRGGRARLAHTLAEAAALRANRFVLGFEIPRLHNRSAAAGRFKRWLCLPVYAHVTGHGLCVRLSLLLSLPLPDRSPLEDMHYSFRLGSHGVAMVPVTSLDRAEVPASIRAQVSQAARWVLGPARFRRYLRDPATRPGWRSYIMAASAFGSTLEWLGCAIVPASTVLTLAAGPGVLRVMAAAVAVTYLVQLVCTDAAVGAPARPWVRIARLAGCPAATTLFGVGGIIGLVRLLAGRPDVGKTERH